MKQFKVFKNPAGKNKPVKQGWCWPAFFFTFWWALVAKMWGHAILLIVSFFLFGSFFVTSNLSVDEAEGFSGIFGLVIHILFGLKGNKWREKHLISKGFELQVLSTNNVHDEVTTLAKKSFRADDARQETKEDNLEEIPKPVIESLSDGKKQTASIIPNESIAKPDDSNRYRDNHLCFSTLSRRKYV